MAKAASGRSRRIKHEAELDMLPVMNLFCCIIPFLLLSASFLEITVISMSGTEGVTAGGAGATANLMRSEEDRLQPKIIITEEEMFIGTSAGTVHVSYSFQEDRDTNSDGVYDTRVTSFHWDSLATQINEVHDLLSESYPQITFRKIIILTVEETRYESIIRAIDIAGAAGFDQPGLQVAPSASVASAMGGQR
jgi:biopolymer transport protein ExbD